ncbi:hypothetical protein, partial [Bradyrhizobium sp. SZCCHNS3004]|uniref:hypothetical protein n=1 Tax=Bradyrhizobium sp. SZCCHNS3004 TaxID=3057312 RepID=UPI0029167A40
MTSPNGLPSGASNNTLCIEVFLLTKEGVSENLNLEVQHWIDEVWMPSNPKWERVWKTGQDLSTIAEKQTLRFEDDFVHKPEVRSGEHGRLLLRLFAKQDSRNWRDWLVLKILPDL